MLAASQIVSACSGGVLQVGGVDGTTPPDRVGLLWWSGAIDSTDLQLNRRLVVGERCGQTDPRDVHAGRRLGDHGVDVRPQGHPAKGGEGTKGVPGDPDTVEVHDLGQRVRWVEQLEFFADVGQVCRTVAEGDQQRFGGEVAVDDDIAERVADVVGRHDDVAMAGEIDRVVGRLHPYAAGAVAEEDDRERTGVGSHRSVAHRGGGDLRVEVVAQDFDRVGAEDVFDGVCDRVHADRVVGGRVPDLSDQRPAVLPVGVFEFERQHANGVGSREGGIDGVVGARRLRAVGHVVAAGAGARSVGGRAGVCPRLLFGRLRRARGGRFGAGTRLIARHTTVVAAAGRHEQRTCNHPRPTPQIPFAHHVQADVGGV